MIYQRPAPDAPIDQGDLIDSCPLIAVASFHPDSGQPDKVHVANRRVIVLTQTCDLTNEKTTTVIVAEVFDAQFLVDQGLLKPAEVKGPIRAGRVWGWYFLPADAELGLAEMIVDLRRLHTVRLDLLHVLCRRGLRPARVQPLYREHLAKHFADTFSRIGLPEIYPTV